MAELAAQGAQIITGLGVLLGAAGTVIWKMSRVIKANQTTDVLNKSAIDMIDVYKALATDAEMRTSEMRNRLEISERERAEMSEQFGKIRSDYEHVSAELIKVSATCIKLEEENKILIDTLSGLEDLVKGLMQTQDLFLNELRGVKIIK